MADDKRSKATIVVPTEDETDEQKQKREEKEKIPESMRDGIKSNASKDNKKDEEMSEEDRLLKERINELMEPLADASRSSERLQALDDIRTEIRSATSSMTSVPKPLKFLWPHFDTFKGYYETFLPENEKQYVADIVSVIGMVVINDERNCLTYRIRGTKDAIGTWGHEYVRFLSGQIGNEYSQRIEKNAGSNIDELMPLIDEILAFDMHHNAEAEACDLLLEVDMLPKMKEIATKENHVKTCMYLLRISNYVVDTEEQENVLSVAYDILVQCESYPDALRVAIKLESHSRMMKVFNTCTDDLLRKQLGFILSSQRIVLKQFVDDDDDEMMEIIGNAKMHEHFMNLARELDVLEPKAPEDIYKSHLADGNRSKRRASGAVDSAKQNLASTFVNAFVNAGFGKDTLMMPEGSDWMYKNKEHGMISATASVGLIMLWDLDIGFSTIDKYSYNTSEYVRAGSLLATGMVSSGISSEMDASCGLLSDLVNSKDQHVKLSAIIGLGISYAGTNRTDITDILLPIIADPLQAVEVASFCALSLGFIFVGSCNDEVCGGILEVLMDRSEEELSDACARFFAIALGLVYLGKGEACDVIIEALRVVEHPLLSVIDTTVHICAYATTGNVLQIQKLLSVVGEHNDEDGKNSHQAVACLGIAAVAMGENLGTEMALRTFDNVLQYCEVNVRRAVPLALGLLSISNPQISVTETLSKLSHDHDQQVSQNALLGIGLLGAGTNNSRIAQMLRQLAVFYQKEPNHLFLVRIAQGLLHLGKGLLTLSPHHSDNWLCSKTSVAALLTLVFTSLDSNNTILGSRHYLLYFLVPAIRPRMLITLDEHLNALPVSVRVGQAVDVVGQAGAPRTITGFQTHTTPVLLSHNERAELATDEYLSLTTVLEGFVILVKNPDAIGVDLE